MTALRITIGALGAWVVLSVPVGLFVGQWLGMGR